MTGIRVLILDENRGFGGAERHVVSLARELDERGVLAGVVGRKNSWLRQACGDDLPFAICGFRNEVDMFSVFSIYKLLKSYQANVLHCIAHRDLVAAALARQLPGAPPVVLLKAEHSFPDDELSPLFRWSYRQCDGVASVSQAMQRALQEKVQGENSWDCQFQIIPNGIELGPDPIERPNKDAPLSIGVLSALRPGKGHLDFLEALAQTSPGILESISISIAGDGPLRQDLEEFCRERELSVNFLGHTDDPAGYLRSLDLCVLPSHKETFSLVALECLAAGVPLLAANSEGVSELYNEPSMLFQRGHSHELRAKIEEFLSNPEQANQRSLELSRHYRQTYSRDKMGQGYCDFYQDLLSKAAPLS